MKYLSLLLVLISTLVFSAPTKWVDVQGNNFSYAVPFTTYEKVNNPKTVGAIMLDIRTPSANGGWTYSRGFIDCSRLMYTGNQKAIDLKLGETVYASQYEQMSWWEQIHPDHWANGLMRQYCGAKR
jgi:hypothetical protein